MDMIIKQDNLELEQGHKHTETDTSKERKILTLGNNKLLETETLK
jgi:hypothetical protein